MNYRRLTISGRSPFVAAGIVAMFVLGSTWSVRAQEPAVAVDQAGFEVQARGPIHEAFADTNVGVTQASPVVPQQPPEPINEVPPDVRPDDASAIWIPGYWAWDDEQQNFMWISGVWRVPPPEAVWVPGYWTQVDGGFQWVSGFWADANAQQFSYLPPPPASLEQGPSSPSPGDNYFYIPGNWSYANGQYVWQPGYWSPYQNGWTWSNSYYRWTPSGYVYVPGRWDVPMSTRGWAFAPVMFQPGAWNRPGFVYRPSTALNLLSLATMLFARNNGWYYYGDYYGNNYAQLGYMPWYSSGYRGSYNPLYGYESWSRRGNNPNWDRDVRERFAEHQNNPQSRPPRHWKDWEDRMRDANRDGRPGGTGQANVVVRGDSPFVRLDENANVQLGGKGGVRVDPTFKSQADRMAKHYQELRDQRRQSELQARANSANIQPGRQPGGSAQAQAQVPGGLQLPRPPMQQRTAKPIDGQTQNGPQPMPRPQLPQRPQGDPQPRTNQPRVDPPRDDQPKDERPKLPDRTIDIPRVLTPGDRPGRGTPNDPVPKPEPMPRVDKPQQQPAPQQPQPQPQPKKIQPPQQQPRDVRPDGGNRPPKVEGPKPGGGGPKFNPGDGGGKRPEGRGGKRSEGGGDKKDKDEGKKK